MNININICTIHSSLNHKAEKNFQQSIGVLALGAICLTPGEKIIIYFLTAGIFFAGMNNIPDSGIVATNKDSLINWQFDRSFSS